jgi:aspartate/methionine/tyrosine aminotransferase
MERTLNYSINQWLSRTVVGLHRVGSRLSTERCGKAKERGVDILHLSGTPITPPGKNVIEAAQRAACENRHPPSGGLIELREAVSQKLRIENKVESNPGEEILITNGAQQALFIAILGIVERGDEVIIPTPAYFTDGIVIL